MSQADLFSVQQDLPSGLLYHPDFITPDEERELICHIKQLPFREARFRQYTARRRLVRFGEGATLESESDQETDFLRAEFPPFLRDVRARVIARSGLSLGMFGARLLRPACNRHFLGQRRFDGVLEGHVNLRTIRYRRGVGFLDLFFGW